MALSLGKSFRALTAKHSRSVVRQIPRHHRRGTYAYASSTKAALSTRYASTSSQSDSKWSKWLRGAFASPFVVAAFWGSSDKPKNDVNTLLADAEDFEKMGQEGDTEGMITLGQKMLRDCQSMPQSEIAKHPEFVIQVLAILTSALALELPQDALQGVEFMYSLARQYDLENKQPQLLRVIYRADYAVQAGLQQFSSAKALLLRELDLVRQIEGKNTSVEQSDLLFYLSIICAADKDASAAKYLEEAAKLFDGITAATLSAEMENYWRMSIMQQLQFALVCEAEGNLQMSKIFKDNSKNLFDGFKRISSNKSNIPDFRELEGYARTALQRATAMEAEAQKK